MQKIFLFLGNLTSKMNLFSVYLKTLVTLSIVLDTDCISCRPRICDPNYCKNICDIVTLINDGRRFCFNCDLKKIYPFWSKKFGNSHPEVFLGNCILKICTKFTGGHPCRSVISIKLQSNIIEITLRHVCSPVNLVHIFRTPFFKVGHSPSKKNWKMMKNAFYFILKALFVLKIFKFLSWLFGDVKKAARLERFMTSHPG